MEKQRISIEEALLEQAHVAVRSGSRFQFRVAEIGGESQIQRFVIRLTTLLGENVRASCGHGLLTVYGDTDGTSVVVATIKH